MDHPLTHRVAPVAGGFATLVMPSDVERRLREIVARWQTRELVLKEWGLGGRLRGEGLLCYFAGPSGTGKTAAAGLIAEAAGLPLYRVNVAGVVSKYIGETEKHLAEILDAAEREGAALVFDEADALFAKRADPKGSGELSHNQQVAYLLDRVERYDGLAFLTTNLDHSIDTAFRRRFHVCIEFALPDAPARCRIWKLSLARAPVAADVDFLRLARTELSGGFIQKAAFNAASRAAIGDGVVGMQLLEEALDEELASLGRLV
jgi:SpoVK/Ycf46/Vps4 family AAA+-type ATPase